MGDRLESADSTMTLNDQRARARAEITAVGGHVGVEHMAKDVSGKVAVDSPAFRAALTRVQHGQAQGIAFAYGDRLSRDWWRAGRFFGELEDAGAELLVAGKRGVDYRTPDGRTQMGMDAIMAERQWFMYHERGEQVADRVIFERGVANVVPYGYCRNATFTDGRVVARVSDDLDDKALVPDPETAPIVRRIFEWRVGGHSWTSMVDELNKESIPSPRGGHWTVSTIRSIVRNEAYLGVARYKDRRNEQAHEPLVSRAVWQAAQAAESVQRTGAYKAGVGGGLLRCSGCGRRLVVAGSKTHTTYGCRRQHNGGRCPAPVFITKPLVDELVDREVHRALEGKLATVPEHKLAQVMDAERQAQAELDAYVEVATALDRGTFERGLRVRQEKLEAAQEARREEEAKVGLVEELPAADEYLAAPLNVRRRVAGALIDRIVVGAAVPSGRPAERLDIHWR
jgi:hypothetical protein